MFQELKFWTVQGVDRDFNGTATGLGPSTVIYNERSQATTEAKRLARKHPDHQFYVMECMYGYARSEPTPKVIPQHLVNVNTDI